MVPGSHTQHSSSLGQVGQNDYHIKLGHVYLKYSSKTQAENSVNKELIFEGLNRVTMETFILSTGKVNIDIL